jgi:hypothetical protein
MCLFPLQRLPESFLILRRIMPDIINVHLVFRQSTCYSCQILMKLVISGQIFEKHNITFYENPLIGSRVAPYEWTDRQTDRHVEANIRFS